MDLIFLVLFVAILLFLFSPTLRAWLLSRLLLWIQRRVLKQMQGQGGRSKQQHYYRGTEGQDEEVTPKAKQQGKLGMDDIVAKKFGKPQSEDYVDFEELPK